MLHHAPLVLGDLPEKIFSVHSIRSRRRALLDKYAINNLFLFLTLINDLDIIRLFSSICADNSIRDF